MTDSSMVLAEKLLNIGGTAGVLYVAIWFLVKTLKGQYESRIVSLEKRSDLCEADRASMGQKIHDLQAQHVVALERMLEDKLRTMTE